MVSPLFDSCLVRACVRFRVQILYQNYPVWLGACPWLVNQSSTSDRTHARTNRRARNTREQKHMHWLVGLALVCAFVLSCLCLLRGLFACVLSWVEILSRSKLL